MSEHSGHSRSGLARFFAGYYRRHLAWVLVALVTVPIYGAASAAVVGLIEPIFRDVLLASGATVPGAVTAPTAAPAGAPIPAGGLKAFADRSYDAAKAWAGVDRRTVVFFTPALVFLVFLVRGLSNYWGGYAFQRIGLGITTDIRNDLYRRYLEQSARFHATYSSADLVSRVVTDIGLMQTALSTRLFDLVQQSITLALLLGLLLSTNLGLSGAVLLAAPLFVAAIVTFGKAVKRTSRRRQVRIAEVTRVLDEGLQGHAVVKAFSAESYELARFRAVTARHLKVSLRVERLANLSPVIVEALAIGAMCLFLAYAGLRIRAGRLTVPLLVQFLANVWLLFDPLRKLNGANMALQQLIAVGERVLALLQVPNEIVDRPDAVVLKAPFDRITFDHVSVRYGERTVVDRVSFEIRRGEVVAIVGASGAGKTTLANLLPRFFDPDEGRVLIDGQDIRGVTVASLRALIGIVTQHTILFDDTVRANIAYARPDTPIETVRAAAAAARAAEFIEAMPDGYETRIGEAGLRLSGGERQRIAIARALVKNAPILVLDEATSQLDAEAETLVHQALAGLMQGRTVLMVAHRLSTVRGADRIVVLDDGAVVESGRHEQLMARGGVYQRMYNVWLAQDDEHPAAGPGAA